MKQCRTFKRLKLQLYYQELSPEIARTLLQHLNTCDDCREAWQSLQDDMKMLTERSRPDPGQAFWAGYWDTLAERINRESREFIPGEEIKRSRRSLAVPAWIIRPVAAVCILVIGIFIGRRLAPGSVSHDAKGVTDRASLSRITARQQGVELLNQSKVMLLGFANFDSEAEDISTLNVPLQRQKSAIMLEESTRLRQRLDSPEDGRLERLLADLEFILLQIANLEDEDGKTAVEIIRSSVDERSILFKITLQEIKETQPPANGVIPSKNTV